MHGKPLKIKYFCDIFMIYREQALILLIFISKNLQKYSI